MGVEDIEHWVVLVLENRSFDHLFGYLEMPHLDNLLGGVHACDGPQGGEAYVFPSTGVATDYITKPDPGHGFVEVCDQVYGFGHRPPRLPPCAASCRATPGGNARCGLST